jgi:hypothetical protein
MLEEELQQDSIKSGEAQYVQENTGCFGGFPEPVETSRFVNINHALPNESVSEGFKNLLFQDTKSQSFEMDNLIEDDLEEHFVPKLALDEFHTIEELTEQSSRGMKRRTGKKSSKFGRRRSSKGEEE